MFLCQIINIYQIINAKTSDVPKIKILRLFILIAELSIFCLCVFALTTLNVPLLLNLYFKLH